MNSLKAELDLIVKEVNEIQKIEPVPVASRQLSRRSTRRSNKEAVAAPVMVTAESDVFRPPLEPSRVDPKVVANPDNDY